MAYLLFIDESGWDHRESPYEVLAGVAVRDRQLWDLVQSVQAAELRHFGRRYTLDSAELKGRKLLKRKVFRLASQLTPLPEDDRRELARACLDSGSSAGLLQLTALAQAKLAYVQSVLDICKERSCKAFASIVPRDAPHPVAPGYLRKDYSYLFERFYYFLEDQGSFAPETGIVVFDEQEKSRSHLLLSQMDRYFRRTAKGRQRASLVIPEPFFVHSDLTTGVQLADLIAYLVAWGWQEAGVPVARPELQHLVEATFELRNLAYRPVGRNPRCPIWSFARIRDLRPGQEKKAM